MKCLLMSAIFVFLSCFNCGLVSANEPLAGDFRNDEINDEKSSMFQSVQRPDQSRFHVGMKVGVNRLGFALKTIENPEELGFNEIKPVWGLGFHIGLLFNLNLTPRTSIRLVPTFAFGERYIEYENTEASGFARIQRQTPEPYLVQLPFHIKYRFVEIGENTGIYTIGGMKYSYDSSSSEGMRTAAEPLLVRVAQQNIGFEVGLGFERQLSMITLSTEIKYAMGSQNIIREGEEYPRYYEAIDRLSSRAIMLSLIIE